MDHGTMFALIAIAMLDTSGGLLLIGMFSLITWKCIQHKHTAALLLHLEFSASRLDMG